MRLSRRTVLTALVALSLPLGAATMPAVQHSLAGANAAQQRAAAPNPAGPPKQPRDPVPPPADLTPSAHAVHGNAAGHEPPADLTPEALDKHGKPLRPSQYPVDTPGPHRNGTPPADQH